jgi:hypothetical protein
MINTFSNTKHIYWLVALIATAIRTYFIIFFPEYGGDGKTYALVAENILAGCGVSMSEINADQCVPHFGGNQGPGYPAFIAVVWALSSHSDLAVRLVQAMFCIASILYIMNAIYHYTGSAKQAVIVGLVLALSPLHLAWPRFFFAETLALAATLWLFAELIKSLQLSKLRVLPIGIALILATFIRLDAVLLLIPVAVTGFIIHRPITALKKGLVIALILFIPWTGWLARNFVVGLDTVFSPLAVELNNQAKGLYRWENTWSTNVYTSSAIHFPVTNRNYDKIVIDEVAFISNNEKRRVKILLSELKQYVGKPFPKHIDEQFAFLATIRIQDDPLSYILLKPITRAFSLWGNINAGMGWPGFAEKLSPRQRIDLASGGIWAKMHLLKKYPAIVAGKIFVNAWKIILYFLFTIAILLSFKSNNHPYRNLIFLALSFILARSALSGWMNQIEARFSVMQMPIIEITTALVLTHTILAWRNNKLSFKP